MRLQTLIMTGTLIFTGPARAHEVQKGPNGGAVIDAGDYHVELVAKERAVDVFITDSKDQPAPPISRVSRYSWWTASNSVYRLKARRLAG